MMYVRKCTYRPCASAFWTTPRAARSLTLPPGFWNSALPTIVHPVFSDHFLRCIYSQWHEQGEHAWALLASAYQRCVADCSGEPVDCPGCEAPPEGPGAQDCRHGSRKAGWRATANRPPFVQFPREHTIMSNRDRVDTHGVLIISLSQFRIALSRELNTRKTPPPR